MITTTVEIPCAGGGQTPPFGVQGDGRDLRAPLLGEHGRDVLGRDLGLDEETIDDLVRRGVVVEGNR